MPQIQFQLKMLKRDLNSDKYLQLLLTKRIGEGNAGWVNVLPYNENLIFLSRILAELQILSSKINVAKCSTISYLGTI